MRALRRLAALVVLWIGPMLLIAVDWRPARADPTETADFRLSARVVEAGRSALPLAAASDGETLPDDDGAPIYLPLIRMPPAFTRPTPDDDAVGQSVNAPLAWSVDQRATASTDLRYTIFLDEGTGEPTTILAEDLVVPVFEPASFHFGTRYAWRVVAMDDRDKEIVGPVWRFQTMTAPADAPDTNAMVYVPAGEFRMGCDAANPAEIPCLDEEAPLHTVYLDAYFIDTYEVTNREYRSCVNAGVCNPPRKVESRTRNEYHVDDEFDAFPVLHVSWWDAQTYCRWEGKRLPTEAEWEKAARGAVDTRMWPWGNEAPDCTRLNYVDDSDEPWQICGAVSDTDRIGLRPLGMSPYGAMDMGGNAFEWVQDQYDHYYYHNSPYRNPQGPERTVHPHYPHSDGYPLFVIRGGSYRPHWYYSRVAHRHWGHHGDDNGPNDDFPLFRNNQVGFRCAQPAASATE